MTFQDITLEERGPVWILTVNRPEARHAIGLHTWSELDLAVGQVESSATCRALVLTSAGPDFIAGGDLKEAQHLITAEAVSAWSDRAKAILRRLERLPVPVIAAMEGHAIGGGCEVALACDMRLAGEGARFSFWEIRNAVTTGWGGGRRLQALIGRAGALELLLSGETITSERALALGLVNRVVPSGQALPAATAMAEQIAAQPPLAVQAMKALLNGVADRSEPEAARLETELFTRTWLSEDHHEAVAAFLARRNPVWRGR